MLENPGWYTAYTPYQAEISQGRLEALLNFQTMISELTGMELANASLLDEATAAAEAMAQLKRINRRNKSMRFLVDQQVPAADPGCARIPAPGTLVLSWSLAIRPKLLDDGECFGMLLQYPGDRRRQSATSNHLIAAAHEAGALAVVAADLLSLVLLTPPGDMGADIVVGISQRFGVPMGFGGPHAAFYATRMNTSAPCPAASLAFPLTATASRRLRMALQTREQHIRRDKATSNICTAQALLAVMASMYAVYHGPGGLHRIAKRIHRLTGLLASGLQAAGSSAFATDTYFDTLCVRQRSRHATRSLAAADEPASTCAAIDDGAPRHQRWRNHAARAHRSDCWRFSPGTDSARQWLAWTRS